MKLPTMIHTYPAEPVVTPGRWARWREHRRQGAGTVAYHLLRRLLERSHAVRWLDVQLRLVIAVPPWRLELPSRLPHELRVRELTSGDLEPLTRLRPANGYGYDQRLAAAHRALGAFLDERLVAFVWIRRGPALLPASFGCVWQLTAPMAWIYDLYSDPGVLGAIPHLYAYLRQHPPGEQCELLVGQTEYDNWASRRAHRRLGYEVRAALWSVKLGGWHLHLSRQLGSATPRADARADARRRPADPRVSSGVGQSRPAHKQPEGATQGKVASHPRSSWERRWRRHGRQALVPLHLFTAGMGTAAPGGEVQGAGAPESEPAAGGFRLQCECGRGVRVGARVGADDERFVCACGRCLGVRRSGVAAIGASTPYWGELPQPQMQAMLEESARIGWRRAADALLPQTLRDYIADPVRAAFQDVLPLPATARVLDVGAGWGGIAATLARHYEVVALEGVAERARFIDLRRQQENLTRLTVIQGDLHKVPLGLRQFDLIVVNGVLEWVALQDHSASPPAVQLVFMHRLRELLAPGGCIYLAIENRYGLAELRGALDHSGLPYTSLMPRFVARWICARSGSYRSHFNTGYRTYTYSHRGYARLFEQVGLSIENTWIATAGYNHPSKLVPLEPAAIRFASRTRPRSADAPASICQQIRQQMRQQVHAWMAREWIWRWIGSDFAFLLTPVTTPAGQTAPTPGAIVPAVQDVAYHA